MRFEEWAAGVPEEIKGDSLWRVEAYRLALFATDLAWRDTARLMQERRAHSLADQLLRAAGSMAANIAEGYSRGTGRDRAHFYEYALGSARESRNWYYMARHTLDEEVVAHRMQLLNQIIRLLLTMVPQQRGRVLRETAPEYSIEPTSSDV